jgi:hypothetical protein
MMDKRKSLGASLTKPTTPKAGVFKSSFQKDIDGEEAKSSKSLSSKSTDNHRLSLGGKRSSGSGVASASIAASSNASLAAKVVRKRSTDSGHIQLEVLTGEKLIPAKKVSSSIL